MVDIHQPQPWTSNPHDLFVPFSYEGDVVGYCKPTHVVRLLDILNEEEKVRKALQLACYDLVSRQGGSSDGVNDLVQQYLAKAGRPKQGAAAIALLLKERQDELDVSDEEFAKFCGTFRLSREELEGIYAGAEIESKQLTPLSRILGLSVDDLITVWQGENNGNP